MTPTRPSPDPAAAAGGSAPGRWAGALRPGAADWPRTVPAVQPSPWTDPALFASHAGVVEILRAVRRALADALAGQTPAPIDLASHPSADRALLGQLLGEGEVAAQVRALPAGDAGLRAQESVFAGVWRVLHGVERGPRVRDTVEVGPVPQGLLEAARLDAQRMPSPNLPRPDDLMNAPAVLEELRDRSHRWRPGAAAHVVNLTLLPLSAGDAILLGAELGAGRVVIESRGHVRCRIVDTRLPRVWRVSYFNAGERVILDTLEVALVPEVACAAPQDLQDSAERLDELLAWVGAS
jgi:hydrogenase-1 operon protein HyaF